MKTLLRPILCVFLTAILALSAASCGADSAGSGGQAARVNDTVITVDQLDTFATLVYYVAGYDPSEMTSEEKRNCLDTMVECEAIRQYYEEQGRDIYKDDYDSGKSSFLDSIQGASMDYLTENNITEDDLIYYYRCAYLSQILYKDVQDEHDEEEIEAEAKEYYEENIDEFAVSDAADEDGSADAEQKYSSYEDVQESVKYTIYNKYYLEKIDGIKESMDIEVTYSEEDGE